MRLPTSASARTAPSLPPSALPYMAPIAIDLSTLAPRHAGSSWALHGFSWAVVAALTDYAPYGRGAWVRGLDHRRFVPPTPDAFGHMVLRHYVATPSAATGAAADVDVDNEHLRLADAFLCAIEECRQQDDSSAIPALTFAASAASADEPAVVPVTTVIPTSDAGASPVGRSSSIGSDDDEELRIQRRRPRLGRHSRKSSSLSQCTSRAARVVGCGLFIFIFLGGAPLRAVVLA